MSLIKTTMCIVKRHACFNMVHRLSALPGMKTDLDEHEEHQFFMDDQHRISKRTRRRRRCPTCSCGSCNAAANFNALGFMNAISALYGGIPNAFAGGLNMFGGVVSGSSGNIPGLGHLAGFGQVGGNRQQTPGQNRGSSASGVKAIASKLRPVAGGSKGKPGRFSQLRDEQNSNPDSDSDTWGHLKGTNNKLLSSVPSSNRSAGASSTVINPVSGSRVSKVSTVQSNPTTSVTNIFNQEIHNITNIENKPDISIVNIENKPTSNLTNLLYQQSLNLTNAPNENNLVIAKEDRYSIEGSNMSASPNSTDVGQSNEAEDDGGTDDDITGNTTRAGGGCPEGYECV